MMTFDEALAVLGGRKSRGMTFGTERLRGVLERAAWRPDRTAFVHVAGTNGKGSVCRMTTSILQAAGYTVGTFTSPSLGGVCDDITVNGVPVSPTDFATYAERLTEHEDADDRLSYFEMQTGVALLYLSERADITVLECGLGGDEDATNVIPAPKVAVITAVSEDHTDILGGSIESITEHKCGIAKPPCVVVTSPTQDERALEVIMRHAAQRQLTVQMPSMATVTEQTARSLTFEAGGDRYRLGVGGTFQADNALLAVQVARIFGVDQTAIEQGLQNVTFACRQEWVRECPVRLMDGGHNPQAVKALADSLSAWGLSPVTAVIGMLADKDVDTAVKILAPHLSSAVCCTPPNPRALSAEALAQAFEQAGVNAVAVSDPVCAYKYGEELAKGDPLVVAGSFYLCAAVRPYV